MVTHRNGCGALRLFAGDPNTSPRPEIYECSCGVELLEIRKALAAAGEFKHLGVGGVAATVKALLAELQARRNEPGPFCPECGRGRFDINGPPFCLIEGNCPNCGRDPHAGEQ
jgi:hypothetical protein